MMNCAELRRASQVGSAKSANRAGTQRRPSLNADGRRVENLRNIGSVSDAQQAVERARKASGLLRTEFIS